MPAESFTQCSGQSELLAVRMWTLRDEEGGARLLFFCDIQNYLTHESHLSSETGSSLKPETKLAPSEPTQPQPHAQHRASVIAEAQ